MLSVVQTHNHMQWFVVFKAVYKHGRDLYDLCLNHGNFLVPTLVDRGCRVVRATNPHGRLFLFSRPKPILFHSSSSSIILTRLSGPRLRPTTSQKYLVAPGIEPVTSGSVARNSDH
jgi:hypothetical protein